MMKKLLALMLALALALPMAAFAAGETRLVYLDVLREYLLFENVLTIML